MTEKKRKRRRTVEEITIKAEPGMISTLSVDPPSLRGFRALEFLRLLKITSTARS